MSGTLLFQSIVRNQDGRTLYNDQVQDQIQSNDCNRTNKAIDVLIIPDLLMYLDYDVLLYYRLICKNVHIAMSDEEFGIQYWKALCISFAATYGLYASPPSRLMKVNDYKKYFMRELWDARNKWPDIRPDQTKVMEKKSQDFKIYVSCRFRPGESRMDNILLPLHQFLKVKRGQKLSKDSSAQEKSSILVGDIDPPEYLDPFLGSLMKDPVLLSTSNRIVDRSVALQSILRGGRDPFNGRKMSTHHLQPLPELRSTIHEWRKKKGERDYSIEVKEASSLIETVDPELVQALLDIERMANEAKRITQEIYREEPTTRRRLATPSANALENEAALLEWSADMLANQETEAIEIIQDEAPATGDNVTTNTFASHDMELIQSSSKKSEAPRVIDINKEKGSIAMNLPGSGVRNFQFMSVHDGSASQSQIYEDCCRDMVVATLNGYNASILCYGQTGAGKTHTFFGPDDALFDFDPNDESSFPSSMGLVLRASLEILNAKKSLECRGVSMVISAQFIEIYEERVEDLLSTNNNGHILNIRRETGEIVGATEIGIHNVESLVTVLRHGHSRKRFAATAMNDRSSRSHTAFILQISQTNSNAPDCFIKSKLHLIDLAGSERVKKSRAIGQRLREAVGINSSLLVLGKVIANLVNGESHVPYFESKLTTMLKGAFGGNCRTCAVINCRPEDDHGDETLQSLRFGERCSMISNSIKAAAASLQSTVEAINSAISTTEEQLNGLVARNKSHLDSFKRLQESLDYMRRKRDLLLIESKDSSKSQI